jgi:hypothetical protein
MKTNTIIECHEKTDGPPPLERNIYKTNYVKNKLDVNVVKLFFPSSLTLLKRVSWLVPG